MWGGLFQCMGLKSQKMHLLCVNLLLNCVTLATFRFLKTGSTNGMNGEVISKNDEVKQQY